jgi:hypothetical protein
VHDPTNKGLEQIGLPKIKINSAVFMESHICHIKVTVQSTFENLCVGARDQVQKKAQRIVHERAAAWRIRSQRRSISNTLATH